MGLVHGRQAGVPEVAGGPTLRYATVHYATLRYATLCYASNDDGYEDSRWQHQAAYVHM